jgi:hypothetical protein
MTAQGPTLRTVPLRALAILALLLPLAACVETSPAVTPTSPAATPDPNVEPVSGISRDALVGIASMPDLGNELLIGVFYNQAKIDPAQLAAAPARICKSRGRTLKSAEDKPLEHPSELPGTRKLVVRC